MAITSFKTYLQCIGNTPMAKLDFDVPPTILAKLDFMNPGGSIKARTALRMIEHAEAQGLLKPGGTIVDASSGNQGISLAMIGALKGYKVVIAVPEKTSEEKKAILRAYGAQVEVCPLVADVSSPDSYHSRAKALARSIDGAFIPDQYNNPQNPQTHYETTGPEIWRQSDGQVTHCFLAMGSCGTVSGVGRYLKEQNPKIRIIGIDAAGSVLSSSGCPRPYRVEGIGVDVVTDNLDKNVIDEIVGVEDEPVFRCTAEMAKRGYLIGFSSAAVMHVALNRAKKLTADDMIVVIFSDSGQAYLSKIWSSCGADDN